MARNVVESFNNVLNISSDFFSHCAHGGSGDKEQGTRDRDQGSGDRGQGSGGRRTGGEDAVILNGDFWLLALWENVMRHQFVNRNIQ